VIEGNVLLEDHHQMLDRCGRMDVPTTAMMQTRIGECFGMHRKLSEGNSRKAENARSNANSEVVSHGGLPTVAVMRFPSSADATDHRLAK
jgi:hypothetical protein